MKNKLKKFLTTDVSIFNKYALLAFILVLLTGVGYVSYALFSHESTSPNQLKLTTGNLEITYGYTGNYQEFIASRSGYYNIETWGARGGGYKSNSDSGVSFRLLIVK